MCCFSVATPVGFIARLFARPVRVSRTRILARSVDAGRQRLAYGMDLDTQQELAMVLPLPVVPRSGDDAVRFIDLSETPRMFDELDALFDFAPSRAKGGLPRLQSRKTLVVHEVGAFVASYVPTRADFERLDARFRLPDVLFDAVAHYADYGFAVFQLKAGKVTVHPMGLELPARSPDKLFFPTVHVHDGRFHAKATFDHTLYYQHPRAPNGPEIDTFGGDAVSWAKPTKTYAGMLDATRSVVRRTLRGSQPNVDTWIEL